MRARYLLPAFVAAVCVVHPIFAMAEPPPLMQAAPPPGCKYIIDNLAPPTPENMSALAIQIQQGLTRSPVCMAQVLALHGSLPGLLRQSVLNAVSNAERRMNESQIGSASSSGGSTSAVSKPATPLSLATEYGGITSSTNNQTATLQAPLDSIPRALAVNGITPYCSTPLVKIPGELCPEGKVLDELARWGVGLTMDTSPGSKPITGTVAGTQQGQAQPVSLSSIGNQSPSFAGAFVKYQVIKARINSKLPDLSQPPSSGVAATTAYSKFTDLVRSNLTNWEQCVAKNMLAVQASQRAETFNTYYTQIVQVLDGTAKTKFDCGESLTSEASAALLQALESSVAAQYEWQAYFDELAADAAGKPALSAEVDYNSPQGQPVNWTAKLVGSFTIDQHPLTTANGESSATPTKSPSTGNATSSPTFYGGTFVYNAGASIYGSTPSSSIPGSSLLRDVQVGAELDWNLASSRWPGILGKIGDTTATVALYDQYQTSPAILSVTPGSPVSGVTITGLPSTATQVFAQKGNIIVAQAKYGFGTGSNAKFPISVTYANRTELIAHPNWGAQVGVSYDFSSLLGSIGGGATK